MRREDFETDPCACGECRQAGMDTKPQLRDPQTGRWLHGYPLARVYIAKGKCLELIAELAARKGMR